MNYYPKQTQTNPTCSELVESILPAYGGVIRRSVCLPACGGAEIYQKSVPKYRDAEA